MGSADRPAGDPMTSEAATPQPRCFCPKCGAEMNARWDGDRLVGADCPVGGGAFEPVHLADLNLSHFADARSDPMNAHSTFRLGGRWFCPADGTPIDGGRAPMRCATCHRLLGPIGIWMLNHYGFSYPHRN